MWESTFTFLDPDLWFVLDILVMHEIEAKKDKSDKI